MNDQDFKRHLKDLAHGHHHPEEHDWSQQPARATKTAPAKRAATKRLSSRKTTRRK